MDFVRKNTNVKFVMTGKLEREEVWDYPLEAVREAVINAVCHRDYTVMSHIEIRIYDNELIVWNPGGLPLGLTMEDLFKPHASKLRNKGIAEVFFDTKIIEQWGSGIEKMINYCKEAGAQEPVFEEYQGFRVIFRKGIFNEEYLRRLGLNERQIKAVLYVKGNGKITNTEYQEISNTIKRTASRDLAELVSLKIFEQIGTTGKGTEYFLSGAKGEKETQSKGDNGDIKGTQRRQRRHNHAKDIAIKDVKSHNQANCTRNKIPLQLCKDATKT